MTACGSSPFTMRTEQQDITTTKLINNLNLAFLTKGADDWNTITEGDAAVMAELWDSLQFLLDDANEPKISTNRPCPQIQ